jgi:hypothetical protein
MDALCQRVEVGIHFTRDNPRVGCTAFVQFEEVGPIACQHRSLKQGSVFQQEVVRDTAICHANVTRRHDVMPEAPQAKDYWPREIFVSEQQCHSRQTFFVTLRSGARPWRAKALDNSSRCCAAYVHAASRSPDVREG